MQKSRAAEQGGCSILSLALAIPVPGVFWHNTFRKMLTTQRDCVAERHRLWKQSHWKGVFGKMTAVQTLA